MVYKTKFVQDLCTTSTEIHEEVIQFALNGKVFLQNVRNLRKSSLEALVYVLLMKRRGKLPQSLQGIELTVRGVIAIVHENYLRLQADSETFGWILSALTLMILVEEDIGEDVRSELEGLVKSFGTEYIELPVYYDVLRTLLILAKERPELRSLFAALEGEDLIGRLASESKVVRMKALACLQMMMEFYPKLFDVWLRMLQDTKLIPESRSFMLHQLLETLLRLEDKQAEILSVIQSDHVWPIVIESLTGKVAVCRKEALAFVQYAIGYAKQYGQDLSGTYFNWFQDKTRSEILNNAWQSFVTIAEALNETQTHLILPALELLEKVDPLHVVWKNLLLQLILLHDNPRVVSSGIQHFLKQRSFDPSDTILEHHFLEAFNRTTLVDNVAETILALKQYYNNSEALSYLTNSVQDISWNSVPYYCIVNVIHDQSDLLKTDETECFTSLKSLSNCLKVCHEVKNVSLRYITVVLLLKTITRYVNRCGGATNSNQLLVLVCEIEKLSSEFKILPKQFEDESGTTFCDAITEEALLAHLPTVQATDKFFIKELLVKRIINSEPVKQDNLLKDLSQANHVIFLNIISQLPETLHNRILTTIPATTADMLEIKHAIQSKTPIPPAMFSTLREVPISVHFAQTLSAPCSNGWREIFTDLTNLLYDRLDAFGYTDEEAVETVQIIHLLLIKTGKISCTETIFESISHIKVKNNFQRHQSATPSIDQIYVMMSEIFLRYCLEYGLRYKEDLLKLIGFLDVGNIDVLMNVLEMLHSQCNIQMLHAQSFKEARFVVIDRCYKEILNYRKSDHFMKLIKKFIAALLRPYTRLNEVAEMDPYELQIDPKETAYIEMFLEQASTIYGLANIVFENVFQLPIPIILNWSAFGKLLLQGIILGDVQKRDQKIENEVIDHCAFEVLLNEHPRYVTQADARVRVLCVLFLYRIAKANHPDAFLFLLKVERMLMERFVQITKAKERYYADSITHRQKLRIIQALCVVLKLTGTKPYPLLEVMLYETNQPNINYLIELIVADSAIDTLTIANSLRNEKVKVSGIQSVFVILWLRCCQTSTLDEKYIYLLLPWTMAQNFSTRLYAQITITKLIAKFSPQPIEEGPFGEIYAAVNSYLRQGNVERNIEKCMKDFRFNSVFDYGNLLTMENIFHNIPKVSMAPPEDVVGTAILKECLEMLELGEGNLGQPLEFDELSVEKRENLFLAQSFGGADFVQRKIVPLKNLEPSQELLLGLPENLCLKKMDFTEGLIVVASLVNRAPNLGGLARTSEIFAVKQFVINSLQDIDNKEFQALSMTAEKWLNVGELKAHKLVEYLEEMKHKGYSIVGAEQTTGSKPIQQLEFPKKCILVLGHEKNGLPAEIIRQLDLIGEIPQFGVVRSLNVHVTGAIFMWEYAKQHLVAKPLRKAD
ncbi:AGAP005789-PA-like protein [Anopheles sinensis]|uniref:AGAP005789-PA-like protein n=1 Tax=Anopheles sinensis TaxID=74873 RepID=A0A084WRT1_ANOSI|nr:AGAP005789-PA-like protein [Anopheles sinensis]